ncbi:hypothetical protein CYG49_04560 [Candidatus Saccharibacteria bacterium]|nr:MAG: hypothetical protein CYG49_04560 [Candidatus Saccharibacteria bacterium]
MLLLTVSLRHGIRYTGHMGLKSFRVENQKALRLAECLDVPSLMVICGSNGAGKSTLLWALKQRQGSVFDEGMTTEVLYQGPHRAIRRQTVRRGWLGGSLTSYAESLSADSVAAPEGLQIPYPSRSPDNVDESGSAIKHALGRLENKRQSFLTSLIDKASREGQHQLEIASLPHVFEPLSEIVSRLLPHLTFEGLSFE